MKSRKFREHIDRRMLKAKQLLNEGRVKLRYSAPGFFLFVVNGETDDHEVMYREGKWFCDCEWNSIHPESPCSHILAAWLWLKRYAGLKIPFPGKEKEPSKQAQPST